MAYARQNGQRLGQPVTATLPTAQVRKLPCPGFSKAEITRRLHMGRTSVRRILTRLLRRICEAFDALLAKAVRGLDAGIDETASIGPPSSADFFYGNISDRIRTAGEYDRRS